MEGSEIMIRQVPCSALAAAVAETWEVRDESDEMGEVGQALYALVSCLRRKGRAVIELDASGNSGISWHIVLQAIQTTPGIIDPHPISGYPISSLVRLDGSRIVTLSS